MRVTAFAALLLLGLAACGKSRPGKDARFEHPAGRADDSVIAKSKLPGASGVRRALEAADTARARRAAEDTIQ